MPKEYLYPFLKNPAVYYMTGADLSSPQAYQNNFDYGLYNIPDPNNIGYTSSYTYDDIKNKRLAVIAQHNDIIGAPGQYIPQLVSELEVEKAVLENMENDYFFFLGQTPGILFFKVFEDLEGFSVSQGSDPSYQRLAILGNEHGELPPYTSVWGTHVFCNFNAWKVLHRSVLSNLPVVPVISSTKASNISMLGDAILGDVVRPGLINGMRFGSMLEQSQSDESLDKFYYSVFLHEFFHTLGYGHCRDGFNISGEINGDALEGIVRAKLRKTTLPNTYGRGQRIKSPLDPNNYYAGFEPPFKYYNPEDAAHDLNNFNTLPDFETIDPDEKKFVETSINSIFEWTSLYWTLYKGNNPGHKLFLHPPQEADQRAKEQYGKIFGFISHLPTFWGGSYTINDGGSKSMLINPTTIEFNHTIGDIVEGGYLFRINEDGTGLINSTSVGVDESMSWSTAMEDYSYWGYSEGNNEWYLPTSSELLEMYNTIGPGSPQGNIGDFDIDEYWSGTGFGSSSYTVDFSDGHQYVRAHASLKKIRVIKQIVIPGEEVRKGPDITVYNPVCDKDDSTKFNFSLPFTLDWYNDEYPPFPSNTRVEDMFSPDLCPCLYSPQTFSNNAGEEKTVTLFSPLIDDITGAEIITTTGQIIDSEDIREINDIYYLNTEYFAGDENRNNIILNYLFGEQGNETVSIYDYFGRYKIGSDGNPDVISRAWLKTVGGVVLPNFPVYIGFMPESPLPAAFKFDPEKIATDKTLDIGKFSTVNDINDPTVYNSWWVNFDTLVHKYLRVGSSDPNSYNYNPFKLDFNTTGIADYIKGVPKASGGYWTVEEFEDFTSADAFNRYYNSSNALTFEPFFNRKIPNSTNPALDLIGNTLFGPFDQNTVGNIMYYNSNRVEPVLPSKSMLERLNYLTNDADVGALQMIKTFASDLYDVENVYSELLPDKNQQFSNSLQSYITTAMDYVYSQRVAPEDVTYGCTNPDAWNYNEFATINDNSCIDRVFGCADPAGIGYNPLANTDDGSCEYYSLIPTEVELITICPSELSEACNTYEGEYIPVDIYDAISPSYTLLNIAPPSEESIIRSMITYSDHHFWNKPEKVAIFNKYRYSGGDCTNPLGSTSEGSLNLGGGCINIPDPSICIFPTIHNYQCDLLGNLTAAESGFSFEGSSGVMPFAEFVTYFDGLSSGDNTIGTCN